jgi:hypothetical protein
VDQQLGLPTDAPAERLGRARKTEAFASREELDKALLVAHASADLVRANAAARRTNIP